MLFSVIIPLYNKESYILETVKSVLQQSRKDFEIIVIDDCSTDKSLTVVRELAKTEKSIKIYQHQKNKGLSATRNTGISHAKGTIVTFLDADDCWTPNFLEEIAILHSEFPKAKIFGTDYLEVRGTTVLPSHKTISATENHILITDVFAAFLGQPPICQSSFGCLKSIFDNQMAYDETIDLAEDIDFYIRIFHNHPLLAYSFTPCTSIKLNISNQLSSSLMREKKFPDFNSYNNLLRNNSSLEKYINFQRYSFAINLKMEQSQVLAKKIIKDIETKQLNRKQKLLLKAPYPFLWAIKFLKKQLLKTGIKLSSY